MDDELDRIMEQLAPLIDEMGEERFSKYCKCYLELNLPKGKFFATFKEYVKGRNRISVNSFKTFLMEKNHQEFIDILRNVDKYNS